MNLWQVADEIALRVTRIFVRNADGRRPVYGGSEKFQEDPHWRDLILFYEYFHGDNGAGIGASHQTGWTALIAPLLDLFARVDAKAPAGDRTRAHNGQGRQEAVGRSRAGIEFGGAGPQMGHASPLSGLGWTNLRQS